MRDDDGGNDGRPDGQESQISSLGLTTKYSAIHWGILKILGARCSPTKTWKVWLGSFAITWVVTYVPMAILALTFLDNCHTGWSWQSMEFVTCEELLPFLRHGNPAMMFLVTLPLMVCLIVTDDRTLIRGLSKLVSEGVLRDHSSLDQLVSEHWQGQYRSWNLWAHIVGVAVGFIVATANYAGANFSNLESLGIKAHHWMVTEGSLNGAGWAYLWCIGVFYFTVTVFLARTTTTIRFLRQIAGNRMAGSVNVDLNPFHPDGCGGLRPIGRIGLRNQYVLSAAGFNIVLHWTGQLHLRQLAEAGGTDVPALSYLGLVLASTLFTVSCPVTFLLPLLPFRRTMRNSKEKLLQDLGERTRIALAELRAGLAAGPANALPLAELQRLSALGEMVKRFPVWPFDAATLRRFLTVYMLPLLGIASGFMGPLMALFGKSQ